MSELRPTYEEECALQSLLPFNGDAAASQRTSVEAKIYRDKLYVHCGLCTVSHVLSTDETVLTDLPSCAPRDIGL